jgi:hypothetical protein
VNNVGDLDGLGYAGATVVVTLDTSAIMPTEC